MTKTITSLCFCTMMLFMVTPAISQTSAKSSVHAPASITQQSGIKIMMQKTSGITRINFLNTTRQNLAFTWSVKNSGGKALYTSKVIVLKPGSTYIYPASGEKPVTVVENGISTNSIKISIKN